MVILADEVRFVALPEYFGGLAAGLVEGALFPLSRLPEMAVFIRSIFAQEDVRGEHYFSLVFELPKGWSDKFEMELQAAYRKLTEEF